MISARMACPLLMGLAILNGSALAEGIPAEPSPAQLETLSKEKVQAALKEMGWMRTAEIRQLIPVYQRRTDPYASGDIKMLEKEIELWKQAPDAAKEARIVEADGLLFSGKRADKDSPNPNVVMLYRLGDQDLEVLATPEQIRLAEGFSGKLVKARYALIKPAEPAEGMPPVKPFAVVVSAKSLDAQAIAALKVERLNVEGVLYRFGQYWKIQTARQSRSGPFYNVMGIEKEAGTLESKHLKWCVVKAIVLREGEFKSYGLFIEAITEGKAAGHEATIQEAAGWEQGGL